MLKTEQIEDPRNTPVSSREFVEAVTSIETRRQEALKQDSLPVGEAIRQLGLDLSSEEVLAEIQAQRRKEAEAIESTVRPKVRKRISKGRAFLIVSLILNFALFIALMNMSVASSRRLYGRNIARAGHFSSGFEGQLQALNSNGFDDAKLDFVKYLAQENIYTSDQARQILLSFTFDEHRVAAAAILHSRVTDPKAFYQVMDTFTFDKGRRDLLKRIGSDTAPRPQ